MAVIPTPPIKQSVSEMENLKNTIDNQNDVQKNEMEKGVSGLIQENEMEKGVSGLIQNNEMEKGASELIQKNEMEKGVSELIQKNEMEEGVSGLIQKNEKKKGVSGLKASVDGVDDAVKGKSCHQCRQRTTNFAGECKNSRNNKPCPIKYCYKCLSNRYGKEAVVAANLENWICPKCTGNCNCSICMKKRGCKPTGILIHTAKAKGYSSVSEMLQINGPTTITHEKTLKDCGSSAKKNVASETESLVSLSRKRIKENIVDEKVESNLQPLSSPPSLDEDNSKKVKLEESRQEHDDGTDDQVEGQDEKSDVVPEIILPVGTQLTTVDDIEVPPEDIGKALQFLEFCAAFGEILDVKNGQPECILRDLIDGRSSRPGRFSLTVQFHICLISLIQEDRGQGSSDLSPSRGKDSWVHALKGCLSGSNSGLGLQLLEHLDQGADGYENLSSSEKLMILNLLCDEVLGTAVIRSWIDGQISEHAGKVKEQKERILAAKDKEKHLKQKMENEVSRAIMERNGVPLSISEHDALVSDIKIEAEQAHTEMLELTGTFKTRNQTCDAVRAENIHFGTNGQLYWRLKCLSNGSRIVVQDVGSENTSTPEERWFSLDDEQQVVVEDHVKKSRAKRRRAPKQQ